MLVIRLKQRATCVQTELFGVFETTKYRSDCYILFLVVVFLYPVLELCERDGSEKIATIFCIFFRSVPTYDSVSYATFCFSSENRFVLIELLLI